MPSYGEPQYGPHDSSSSFYIIPHYTHEYGPGCPLTGVEVTDQPGSIVTSTTM